MRKISRPNLVGHLRWLKCLLGWWNGRRHFGDAHKKDGISLSKVERSSDQVIKPVNLDALSKWVGKIPDDVVQDMAQIAPMLAHFGYDPEGNPPNYGKPDQFVVDNTNDIKAHDEEWEEIAEKVKQLSKNCKARLFGKSLLHLVCVFYPVQLLVTCTHIITLIMSCIVLWIVEVARLSFEKKFPNNRQRNVS